MTTTRSASGLRTQLLTCPAQRWIKARLLDGQEVVRERSVDRGTRTWADYTRYAWDVARELLTAEVDARSQGELF